MEKMEVTYEPKDSFLRVATACPEVTITDVDANVQAIYDLYEQATQESAALVVFPELSLTGYTIGDLLNNQQILRKAEAGLIDLAEATSGKSTAMIVGLPMAVEGAIYNAAAILADGQVKGIVPKQNLPTYGEFYEKRWFQKWANPNTTIKVGNQTTLFGNDLLFDIGGVKTGIEICEDLWVADPPSRSLAQHGALLIANPSASPELIGKAAYRRQLVSMQAAKLICAYAYAGCDSSESTMDIVMGGHQIIAENGHIREERKPFSRDPNRLLVADLDIDKLRHDRRRDSNWENRVGMTVVECLPRVPDFEPEPYVVKDPFLPAGESQVQHNERLQSVIDITSTGLAKRLQHAGIDKLTLGLSGGLDSTLALLIAVKAAHLLGRRPSDMIYTLTMPGPASSGRTQNNSTKLAQLLGVNNEIMPIGPIIKQEFATIRHDGQTQDVTFENVQARARTSLLFNYGNNIHALVLGTGDLTELALGWCTYNGDHMSSYGVNSSIPKTLVRHLVNYLSETAEFQDAHDILQDILATPISPELKGDGKEISQASEENIGPYILHEFFLTELQRWGAERAKIQFLAEKAFKDDYSPIEIAHWLSLFLYRYFTNQFKRSVLPDGAKVGSVAVSPRGDLRLPSDIPSLNLWR